MSEFKKYDEGKIMPSLIEPAYIKGTAKILTFGASKYGKDNWKSCEDRGLASRMLFLGIS